MSTQGSLAPSGTLGLHVIRNGGAPQPVTAPRWPTQPVDARKMIEHGLPASGLPEHVNRWRRSNAGNLWRGARRVLAARALGISHNYGALYLTVFRGDGTIDDYGLASLRVVTTAGVTFIATRLFDANTSIGNFDFHGFGVGTTAEATGDTALVTEETTQYATDNTRPTGTPSNPSGNVYQSVATYSPDSGTSPRPITEHGLFSQAATGGGTLLDRSVFSAVNLVTSSDSLQATYQLTLAAGG
jgi:hypothetical protein